MLALAGLCLHTGLQQIITLLKVNLCSSHPISHFYSHIGAHYVNPGAGK